MCTPYVCEPTLLGPLVHEREKEKLSTTASNSTQVQKLPICLCSSPLQDGKKNCQPELSNERDQDSADLGRLPVPLSCFCCCCNKIQQIWARLMSKDTIELLT